jgi:uncharacterized damage-inducible protein DinB
MDNDSTETQAQRLEQVLHQLEIELQKPSAAQHFHHRAGESEWSAMQILGHMLEMIPYWLHYCQQIIAATADDQVKFGRGEDAPERLEGVESVANKSPQEVLPLLKKEITAATQMIRAMSPAERAKTGVHIRRGEITVADIVENFVVAHAEAHLGQIDQALQASI